MEEKKRKEVVDFLFNSLESYSKELNVQTGDILKYLNNVSIKVPDYSMYPSFFPPHHVSNEKWGTLHDILRVINSLYFLEEGPETNRDLQKEIEFNQNILESGNFLSKELNHLLAQKNKKDSSDVLVKTIKQDQLKNLNNDERSDMQKALQSITQKIMLYKDGLSESYPSKQEAESFQDLINNNIKLMNLKYVQTISQPSPLKKQGMTGEHSNQAKLKRSGSQVIIPRNQQKDDANELFKQVLQNTIEKTSDRNLARKNIRITKQVKDESNSNKTLGYHIPMMFKKGPTPEPEQASRNLKKIRITRLNTSISGVSTTREPESQKKVSIPEEKIKTSAQPKQTQPKQTQTKVLKPRSERNRSVCDLEPASRRELVRTPFKTYRNETSPDNAEALSKPQLKVLDKYQRFIDKITLSSKKTRGEGKKPIKDSIDKSRRPPTPGGS